MLPRFEPDSATCSTGASTTSKGELAPLSPRAEKAVALTISSGPICAIAFRSQPSLSGSFRLGDEQSNGPDTTAAKFVDQLIDWIGVGGGKESAIEHHQCDGGTVARQIETGCVDFARSRQVEATASQRRTLDRWNSRQAGGER